MEGFSSELSIRSQSTTAVTPFSFPHAPLTKKKEEKTAKSIGDHF
jgi:hypothetical protein